jgi:hypothetical protein
MRSGGSEIIMRKELSLTIKDLRYVAIKCRRCGTDVVLDMGTAYEPEPALRTGITPPQCPTCSAGFDSAIKPALDRFRSVYTSLANLEPAVTFRVIPDASAE